MSAQESVPRLAELLELLETETMVEELLSKFIAQDINIRLHCTRYAAPHFGAWVHDTRTERTAEGGHHESPLLALMVALVRVRG